MIIHEVLVMRERSCTNLIKFNDSVTKYIMYYVKHKTYNKNCYKTCDKSCAAEQTTALITTHVMFGSMRRGLHFYDIALQLRIAGTRIVS